MTLEQKEKSSIFSFGSLGRRSGSKCIKWDLPPTPCLCHLFIGQLNSVYILVENALTNGWPKSEIISKAIYMCVCIYMWSSYQSSVYPRMLPIMKPCYWNPLGLIIKAFVSLLQCTQWQQSRLEAQDTAEESHLYSAGFSFLWIFKCQDWQTYRVFYKPLKS